MDYDFTTLVNRSAAGSLKWLEMRQKNPDIGPDIVPFSVADMELRNPPEIIEGLKQYLDRTVLGYTDPTPSYFDAVCGWMKRRHNWDVRPEWILCADGVVPAFHNAVKAFTSPGDGVILMTPAYYPFYRAIANNQRKLVATQLVARNGRYEINFDELERLAQAPENKILLFCSPQNPVGRVWTREELTRVGRICIDNDVLILSDEIHFDLIMPGFQHTVFATISEEFAQHCIVCTAPSKTFNIAGMEVSNIIIPNADLRKRYRDEEYTTGRERLNLLGYQACEIAYTQCDAWLSALLVLIQENYDYVCKFMAAHFPEITVYPLEGTYLLWMDFRRWGLSPQDLEDFMVHKALLFMDEGYVFGKGGEGFERMNLACPSHVLREALERFRTAALACGVREGNLSWKK